MIAFLPGPEVGRRDRGDPAQHGGRARARPAARAAPRQGHPVQRAAGQGEGGATARLDERRSDPKAGAPMNLALSDEQEFLREAARGALVAVQDHRGGPRRARGRRAARPVARRARGRLARAAGLRGARRRRARRLRGDARGRGVRPRARAASRCWATLPATAILDAAGGTTGARGRRRRRDARGLDAGAAAGRRAGGWTVEPERGKARAAAPRREVEGDDGDRRPARSPGCPTRRAPTCSWSSASTATGARAVAVEAAGDGVEVERVTRYDATRSLGHVRCDGAPRHAARRRPGRRSRAPGTSPRRSIAAESRRHGADDAGDGGPVRQGALHLRARDRLLPGGQARR